MTMEAITFFLPASIGSMRRERVLLVEWFRYKLAEAGQDLADQRPIARRCRDGLAFPGKPGANLHPRRAGKAS
jgi:hypothetical protein